MNRSIRIVLYVLYFATALWCSYMTAAIIDLAHIISSDSSLLILMSIFFIGILILPIMITRKLFPWGFWKYIQDVNFNDSKKSRVVFIALVIFLLTDLFSAPNGLSLPVLVFTSIILLFIISMFLPKVDKKQKVQ